MRAGPWRRLSTKELMFSNCGFGEDSWESLGLQGDPTSPSWRKLVLNIHWKEWYWSWNSNPLATWCEQLTHWKRPCCCERKEKGTIKEEIVGWLHHLMNLSNSGRWWRTLKPGLLLFMGLQRFIHGLAGEQHHHKCFIMQCTLFLCDFFGSLLLFWNAF